MERHVDSQDSSKASEKLSHHRAPRQARGKPKRGDDDIEDEEDSQEEEEGEQMVFLTKQPSCIKFGTMKPYQVESLNWMIHLAQKGLNGILAGKYVQCGKGIAYALTKLFSSRSTPFLHSFIPLIVIFLLR